MEMRYDFGRVSMVLCVAAALALAPGCDKSESSEDTKAAATETEEQEQKIEKLIFAFQPQANPQGLSPNVDKLSKYLGDQIGVETKVFLPQTYAAVVEALRAKNADVAYFSGWPYLIAHREANAEILVAEVREGNPYYYSHWYVRSGSGVEELADLRGKDASFTSPTSTSGYLFPTAKLVEEGLLESGEDPAKFFGNVIFAGGYQQSLMALVNGKVDAAAASNYAFDLYLSDEQKEQVETLTRQGPVPTHCVAVRGGLPDDLKEKIREALLSLNEPENRELLESVYGAEKFVPRTHEEHVTALEKALKLAGQDIDLDVAGSGSGSGHHEEEGAGSGSGHHEEGAGSGHHEEGAGSGSGHHE
jgi:phosphonate transport system substrate-binding protein